jgi:hypothetical protein
MAAIASPNPISVSEINNFTGELFKVGARRTPLLSMVGGLSGGKLLNSPVFQTQQVDTPTVNSYTAVAEGGTPTYFGRSRSSQIDTLSIFNQGVKLTYSALASTGYLNSQAMGTGTAAFEGTNPVQDELAFQMEELLSKIAREVEYTFFNSSFNDGTDGNPRAMRGLLTHLDNDVTVFHDTDGNGDGDPQDIDYNVVATALKEMYDNGAPMQNPVLFVRPQTALDLNLNLAKNGSNQMAILPRDRNVAGINIDTLVTPFGNIGLVVNEFVSAENAFILDLGYLDVCFLNIPGKGGVFVEDTDNDDAAAISKRVYMEIGLDKGPKEYHCKIYGVN